MKQEELNVILEKHRKWLNGENGGERADLSNADLRGADLRGANLKGANLSGADLRDADLRDTDLNGANLRGADLKEADLNGADLSGADLCCVDLRGADLNGANLRGADLKEANLDCSCLPLWCGSLKANVDDRIAIQLLYHTLSVVQYSNNVSEELKEILLTEDILNVANRFHRVGECGKLKKDGAE